MIKRFYVRRRELQPGMRIDQSIVDKMRRVLIAKGTYLDEYLIDSLGKLGIAGVYVSEGEEDPIVPDEQLPPATLETIEKLKVEDRSKVTLSESVKKRVSKGIQYLFNNTEGDQFEDATQAITDNLMQAISDNEAIAVDVSALKVSDEYTFKHSVDVATISMIIAKRYGLSEEEVHDIGVAGLLHDMGKAKIPNEILNKPDRLTDEEFAMMKQHTLFGYSILKDKKNLTEPILKGVLQHHEKINGQGYPQGLTEDKIHLFAKIIAVADVYDALVTERPYKKAFSQRDAVEIIMSMTDELDIKAMRCFFESVILYPVGSTILLSNGERARVVENNPNYILRPKVVGLKTGKVYDLSSLECASIIVE